MSYAGQSKLLFAKKDDGMLMQTTYMVILGVTCMVAAGCIPVPIPGKIETSPEVYGRVVEAGSEQPIAGAKVTFKDLHGTRRSETTTQTNGTFQIGPEWHSYWVVVFTACPVYQRFSRRFKRHIHIRFCGRGPHLNLSSKSAPFSHERD